MKKILILLITCLFISCSLGQISKPKDLEEAISYFQKRWSKRKLKKFKNKDEREAVAELHLMLQACLSFKPIGLETKCKRASCSVLW